ncbi:MAG: phosphate acyltransferase, partial [Rhodospirillales bacterium]
MRLTLSLDAMGGDNAPLAIVEGVDKTLDRHPDVDFLLFGDEAILTAIVEGFPRVKAVALIHHTTDVITNDQKPGTALRSGKNSSMRLAI